MRDIILQPFALRNEDRVGNLLLRGRVRRASSRVSFRATRASFLGVGLLPVLGKVVPSSSFGLMRFITLESLPAAFGFPLRQDEAGVEHGLEEDEDAEKWRSAPVNVTAAMPQ